MWTILIFLGILFLFAIFIALAFVVNLLSSLVGGIANLWYLITGKKAGRSNNYSQSNSYNNKSSSNFSDSSSSTGQQNSHSHKKGEKVFTADEGEYVSFEEVKD